MDKGQRLEASFGVAHLSGQLGRRLRELRQARGWSIGEAAARAGLSRNTLGNVEVAELPNPTLITLFALMDVYGVKSLEELLGPTPSEQLLREWIAAGRPGLRQS